MSIKKKSVIIALSSVLFIGCTSSTREIVNNPIKPKVEISNSLSNINQKHLKRVVAIGRFTDETKRGNSFLLDSNGNKIGKQASDILSARLSASKKFIMLERSDISILNAENPSQKVRAKYLIVGSVSEYGRSSNSDVGIFSRNKKQTANTTVNIRIIDTRTSQIVYSEEGTGEATSEANNVFGVGERAGYDLSLDDKSLSAAISKLTSNIMENLMDSPWESHILSYKNGNVIFAGGESQGIKIGNTFDIRLKGETIKNPQTGFDIQLPSTKVASIKVIALSGKGQNEISIATVSSGHIDTSKTSEYLVQEEG